MIKQAIKRAVALTGFEVRRIPTRNASKLEPVEFTEADRDLMRSSSTSA